MENSLKQRIIGAIVLVALGVIFLPSILKEKTTNGVFESKIPKQPKEIAEYKMDTYKIDELLAKETTESEKIKHQALESKNKIENKPDVAIVSDDQLVVKPNVKETEKITTEDPINSGSWIIQVASFTNQQNASKLVTKLIKNGHKAYKSRRVLKEKTVFRVFVGPYINKSKASDAISDINKISGIKAMLKVFNPINH